MPNWLPDLASVTDSLYFLVGGILIALITRWWAGPLDRRTVGGYLALTFLFFSIPLATPQYQLPLDYIYQFDPWRESLATGPDQAQNPLLSDVALQMIPFRTLVRDRLLSGQAPLWSHELGTGQPLLGNAQSAPFAPLHLLALPLPPLRALTVVAAWQVLASMLLMHLLLVQLGASNRASTLAAIAYSLSVFQIGWLYHPLSMVSAFLPGLLLAVERLRQREPRALAGIVICATTMLLSGNPGVAAVCSVVVIGWWLRALIASSQRRGFLWQSCLATLIALGLSAPAILPLSETIPASERALVLKVAPETVQPSRFEASHLRTLVTPFASGSPRDGNWSGTSNFLELSTGFAGLLTLILALVGALVFQGAILGWMITGLVAILVAMGSPPLFDLVNSFPFLSQLPLGRLRLIFVLATAIAAGLSFDRVVQDRRARSIAAILMASGLVVLQFIIPEVESPWQAAWRWSVSAGLLATLLTLSIPKLRRRFAGIAIVVVLVDLALFGLRFHPITPSAMDLRPPEAIIYLRAQWRSEGAPWRVSAINGRMLPYLSSAYGLWDPRGFDPMRPGDALQLLRERLDRPALVGLFLQRAPLDQGFLDFLGVRYLLTGSHDQPGPSWSESYRDNRVVVWENKTALPLFFVPERIVPCESNAAALEFAKVNEDFQKRTCVSTEPENSLQKGTVSSISVAPNSFAVEIESSSEAIVASSVTWMPGWKLHINSQPAEIVKTNGAFLGAEVGTGQSVLRFYYTPWQWRIGWIGFFLALALGLLVAVRHRTK